MGFGRLLGASFLAAVASSVAGGLSLLLILFLGAVFAGTSSFEGPVGDQIAGIWSGICLWAIASLLMGFVSALFGALFGILPAHLVLQRLGHTGRYWYAAAGAVSGVLSILILAHPVWYLQFFVETEGLVPLLIAGGVGEPVGALLFRRISQPTALFAVPKTQPIG